MKRLLISILFVFMGLSIVAQNNNGESNTQNNDDSVEASSLDSAMVPYIIQEDYLSYDIYYTDTSLVNFQQIDPVRRNKLYLSRGRYGLSHQNLLFSGIDLFSDQFDIGESSYEMFYFNWKKNPIYHARKATSDVAYGSGPNEEQYMYITLTNPVSKTVYINLDYQLQNGQGDYLNQIVRNKQFRSTVAYNTLNHRFISQFTFTRNTLEIGENGGIIDDSFYTDSSYSNRFVIPVNLDKAKNEYKSNTFFLSNHIALGKRKDSVSTLYPLGSVFFDVVYNNKYRMYYDEDTSFYSNTFLDSSATGFTDSIYTKQMYFRFGYDRYSNTDNAVKLKVWAEYQLNHYFANAQAYRFDYFVPKATVAFNWRGVSIRTLGSYQILMNSSDFSYGTNNYLLAANARQKIGENFAIDASFKTTKQTPMMQHFIFYSNHYMWDNSSTLKDEFVQELAGSLRFWQHKLSAKLTTIENYTNFYDEVGTQQANNTLNHVSVQMENDFHVPYFGVKSKIAYQQTSNESAYDVPELSGRFTMYTYFHLFNHALKIEPGIDLFAITSYYAPYYNPAIGRFLQQRTTKVDDQIYADFFVNFKIKKARVFVKYQHFNTLFMDYNHFMSAHYPMQDAMIKFGVSWKFYN